jgi:hypothetical protein
MQYVVLRCRLCDIILNVHASTEYETDNIMDSLHEALERRELKSALGRPA